MEIKLCKDCKHCQKSQWLTEFKCKRIPYEQGDLNLIDGTYRFEETWIADCLQERYWGACGSEGKFWEAKDEN